MFGVKNKWDFGDEWLPKLPKSALTSLMRSKVPVRAYIGLNGSGKTLAAVNDLMPVLQGKKWNCENPDHFHTIEGKTTGFRKVLSSVELLDPRDGSPHPLYVPLTSYNDFLNFEHGSILLDEVQGIASSAAYSDVPVQVKNLFHQFRRKDTEISYTGITYTRALKELREVTRVATFCRGFFDISDKTSTWAHNSFFYWSSFDASELEAFVAEDSKRIKPKFFQIDNMFRTKFVAHQLYNSHNAVNYFGNGVEWGTCLVCSGKKIQHRCSCEVKHGK